MVASHWQQHALNFRLCSPVTSHEKLQMSLFKRKHSLLPSCPIEPSVPDSLGMELSPIVGKCVLYPQVRGAVRKNIISDKFSTKTAISAQN